MMKDKRSPQLVSEAKRMGSELLDFSSRFLKKYDPNIIPGIDLPVSLAKTLLSIREALLIRDLGKFQRAFDDMPDDVKERFIQRLENEPYFEEKVARILMDLPFLDEEEKVTWLVNFMRAYTSELIDHYRLDCFRYTLRNSLVQDLEVLIEFIEANKRDPEYKWVGNIDEIVLQRLASAGLLFGPTTTLGSVHFGVNEYGESFVTFGRGENE